MNEPTTTSKVVLTLEQAKKLISSVTHTKDGAEEICSNVSYRDLCAALGFDKKAKSVCSRWLLFIKVHGSEAFIDYFVHNKVMKYSDAEYLSILAYARSTHTPIDRTWVIFKCSRRKLENLSAKANKGELDLSHITPAEAPANVVAIINKARKLVAKSTSDACTSAQATAATTTATALNNEHADSSCRPSLTQGETIVAVGSTANDEIASARPQEPVKIIHGKSKQAVIKPFRPQKKNRRKDVEAAKKQQQAIREAQQRALQQTAGELPAVASNNIVEVLPKLPKVHPRSAMEGLQALSAELHPASEYVPQKRGRTPHFDVNSAGFEDLPKSVRERSRKYQESITQALILAEKEVKKLPPNASPATLFKACQALHKANPKLPLKALIYPFGFTYVNYKYYEMHRNPELDADVDPYAAAKAEMIKIFADNKCSYGKYRLRAALYKQGYAYCIPTVAKLMRECGLKAITSKGSRKYSSYLGTVGTLAPNILKRNFSADRPFQKIVTDVTEIAIGNKKLYLAPYIDLFNNEIVGYSMACSPSTTMVVEGLKQVIKQTPAGVDCVIHSDQGHQYQRAAYRSLFAEHPNLKQSMSRKGNCLDNGACESWFGRMKHELQVEAFDSVDALAAAIEDYISYYNNERIQSELNGLSPVVFKIHMNSTGVVSAA